MTAPRLTLLTLAALQYEVLDDEHDMRVAETTADDPLVAVVDEVLVWMVWRVDDATAAAKRLVLTACKHQTTSITACERRPVLHRYTGVR